MSEQVSKNPRRLSTVVIGQLEHVENSFERIIWGRADVHSQHVVPVGNSSHVSGSEQDVAGRQLMVRSGLYLERCQRWVRQELHIGYQSGDGLAFAVPAKVAQSDVKRLWCAG